MVDGACKRLEDEGDLARIRGAHEELASSQTAGEKEDVRLA